MKFWYVAVAFLFIQCGPVSAEGQNCAADYYRTKLPSCVDSMLSQLRQMATSGKAEPNTIIGFLAQLFSTSPAERQRILDAEPSDYVRSVDLMALYRAGLPDDARKFADKNQLSAVLQKLETTRPALLAAVRPSTIPADNDLLIGAYMASGDTTFIDRILGNFSGADDSLVSDAFRIGFIAEQVRAGLWSERARKYYVAGGLREISMQSRSCQILSRADIVERVLGTAVAGATRQRDQ